jgi:serine/threonine protein kinase
MDYFLQILDILQYLHTQNPPLIYRDLNPRNVMVSSGRIFLVDFGIARVFTPHEKGTAIGTPGYAPPEQYKGFAGPRSDLYSLGVMMHYLITGIDPESSTDTLFSFVPVRQVNPEVPEYLEKVIMSMVDLVPERRPSSAGETAQMIRAGQEQPGLLPQIDAHRSGNTCSWTDVFASNAEKILQRLEKPVQVLLSKRGVRISGGALRALVTGAVVCVLLLVAIVIPRLLYRTPSSPPASSVVKTAPGGSASPAEPVTAYRDFECIKTLEGETGNVYALAFSPDGQYISFGGFRNSIELWSIETAQCLRVLKGHTYEVFSLSFSPDGQSLASGSVDDTIRIWRASTGECLRTIEGGSGDIFAVGFSPDGAYIVSGGADNAVKVWIAEAGTTLWSSQEHRYPVFSAAFSPDGKSVVSGSGDTTIKVWDAMSGQCLRTLEGHSDVVYRTVFSPDGKCIISCGFDKTIKVWNSETGECLRTLDGYPPIAVSPDGIIIACGSNNNSGKTERIREG